MSRFETAEKGPSKPPAAPGDVTYTEGLFCQGLFHGDVRGSRGLFWSAGTKGLF